MREKSAQMLRAALTMRDKESKGNMMRSKAQALQAPNGAGSSIRDLRADQKTLAGNWVGNDFAF